MPLRVAVTRDEPPDGELSRALAQHGLTPVSCPAVIVADSPEPDRLRRAARQLERYDWLVVAGARAQYKGIGTINGLGSYQFILTAIDGQVNGGGGVDRFRIKIWHYDATSQTDVVDYDNQIDSSTIGTLNEGTKLGGGSIVIHSK